MRASVSIVSLAITALAAACGGGLASTDGQADGGGDDAGPISGDDGSTTTINEDSSAPTLDGGAPIPDSGMTKADSAALPDSVAPGVCNLPPVQRLPCLPSSQLATTLPMNQYGAVEAELVSILPPGTHGGGCPNDSSHVHLQIAVNGSRYDIAIDDGQADGVMFYYSKTLAATLPGEGWSTTAFDYKTTLGVHSTDFTQMTPAQVDAQIVAELANVSRLTIHGLSYSDGTGAHDVHYNHGGKDGVLLLHGQGDSCGDKAVALRFKTDTF